MTTIFGIQQCDTCRRAQRWAEAEGHVYRFHDLRRDGLDSVMLEQWLQSAQLDELINRRSRTWRELDEDQRESPGVELLLAHPTVIKRPVLVRDGAVLGIGFKPDVWQTLL